MLFGPSHLSSFPSLFLSEAWEHHLSSLYLGLPCLLPLNLSVVYPFDFSMARFTKRYQFRTWIHFVVVWVMSLDNDLIWFPVLSTILFATFPTTLLAGIFCMFDTGWPSLSEVGMVLAIINRCLPLLCSLYRSKHTRCFR